MIPKWMNVVRAVSSEGFGRIRYHETISGLLETDKLAVEIHCVVASLAIVDDLFPVHALTSFVAV